MPEIEEREALQPYRGDRELIVIAAADAALHTTTAGLASTAADVSGLEAVLARTGAKMLPLFGPEERVRTAAASVVPAGTVAPDLSRYYHVEAPDADLDELAEELRGQALVEAAYVKPPALPADLGGINDMVPTAQDAPPATPDYTQRQGYLGPAPDGIDARHAWAVPGGTGAGMRIIDIEGAWRFTHEDLTENQGGVVGGTQYNDIGWRNHGTAVIGEFGGDRNGLGVTGICADANVRAISVGGLGTAGAIRRAADLLSPGDVILIEIHRAGPRATGVGQQGYIAIEWWPDDYDAIRYATARGVIVVEAAGNGAQNLDDPIYDRPAAGFPANWANPFRRGARDSGAILVGAGAPPPGTHGRNWGPDRSRLDFSNFGAALDVQGWGREVTTCGYGDLQGGPDEDLWYTDQFSGTSSASPIVVGAVVCVQGALRAAGRPLLTPASARTLLRSTGSPQQARPGSPVTERIGNRPNLRQALARVLGGGVVTTALYRYWNPRIGDHFYTTSWRELGPGAHGWRYEGIQCYVGPRQVAGTIPLYRYWNPRIGDHFYTTSWRELGPGAHGWRYEGIQCYVYPQPAPNRVPLYRYWNPRIGDHFYTTNWRELGPGAHGWGYEGVQCYVATQVRPPDADGTPGEEDVEGAPASFRVDAAATPLGSLALDAAADEEALGMFVHQPDLELSSFDTAGGQPPTFLTEAGPDSSVAPNGDASFRTSAGPSGPTITISFRSGE